MNTIFITIFQGVEAKNILRTDIYNTLIRDPNIQIVFFVGSSERADYYRREFNHSRVCYEVVENNRPGRWDKFISFLKFKLIQTETLDLRRKMALQDSGRYFNFAVSWLANRLLARSWIRRMVRLADGYFIPKHDLAVFFDKYNPNLVFLAHLFDDLEIAILKEAKRRKILTVGFINSWDKLTSRGMIRILPDKLVVFNDIIKVEALEYADMKAEDIFVSGVPQYDIYFNAKPSPKSVFYARLDLAESKRILVYAPMGKYFSGSDWDIIDLLYKFKNDGRLPDDVDVLVRFQPNDFVDELEISKRPWLIYDYPGIRFSNKRGVDWDMSSTDLKHLTDTLYHASLFICYATSLSIDVAIFDKPVINIDFEVEEKQFLSQTPTFFYKTTHYGKAMRSGGIKFVDNENQLLEWINKYLNNPEIDRAGRINLVRQQCQYSDAKSGERIAYFLVDQLGKHGFGN